jgi:cytosol alanyl aminopeptidase
MRSGLARRRAALAFALAVGCGGSRPEPRPVEPAPLPVAEEGAEPDGPPAGRLGDSVVPRRTALDITLDPRATRFTGVVEHEIDVIRPVSAIWLNAAGLRLGRAELIDARGARPLRWIASPPGRAELVGLAIGRRVGPGRARLRIEYSGQIGDRSGLFHQRLGGQWYAYTDFEPTDARTALPAFDDPKFKVRWRVTLRVPAHLSAFSNTPPVRERTAGAHKAVEFAETRPLPTYLLAFAAGPFEVATAAGKSSIPIRVIVPRGLTAHARDALAATPRLLALAEKYMGSRSPYDKLDLIAVPEFNGAMENPGLVTVAAGILLIAPGEASGEERRERLDLLHGVLAHEIAHYWFGDLVTMRYWDELWLNEGLATWMSDWMVVALDPVARTGSVVDIVDKARAIRLDRRAAAPRMRVIPQTREEMGMQFGPQTYRKGGALLAMFEALLGTEAHRTALRAYAERHADGSVTANDLAQAWSRAAGRDLGPALRSFIDQPGIPVVSAALECKAGKATVALRQTAYHAPLAARPPTTRWQVPVCVAWAGGRAPACTLLERESGSLELPAAGCPAWIHPNPGERGYYLYALPGDQLRSLVQKGGLSRREQAGLADDIDTLLRSGQMPLADGLDALAMLAAGKDRLTAGRALDTLRLVARAVVEPKNRKRYATLVGAWTPLVRELGLIGSASDGGLTGDLRQVLVATAARDGNDAPLQKQALRALDEWLKRPPAERDRAVDSELLTAAAAPVGGAALYDRLLSLNDGQAQPALAAFRQPELVGRTLAAISEDKVSAPVAIELLARLIADPVSQPQALPVALARFRDLVARLADTDRPASARVFAGACRAESRAAVASALTAGLADKNGALPGQAALILEVVDECIAFRRLHQSAAAVYLK